MKKILFFSFLLVSCSSLNVKKQENKYSSLSSRGSIAVLPFDNLSNDITAETMIRDMITSGLEKKGWLVIKNEVTDEKLKSVGITDGGQLNSVTPKEISELLTADYLLYGTIEDFKLQNLGYVVKKTVEINVKIVKGATEETVFDEKGSGGDFKVFLKSDEAKKAFIEYNALKLVQNIVKRPLYKEAKDAVSKILNKIP
ncbi:MAG: GNA1162 family protein [Elusimicrobiales bacterium]